MRLQITAGHVCKFSANPNRERRADVTKCDELFDGSSVHSLMLVFTTEALTGTIPLIALNKLKRTISI